MKPLVNLQLLDSSLRYLAVHPRKHTIVEQGEIVFDTAILKDRQIANRPIVESRLDALVREKKWRRAKTYILLIDDFVAIKEEIIPAQLKADEVQDYLALQMNDTIRIPFEKPIFEYEILDQGGNETRLVLVAYPGEYIEEYRKILRTAKLKPEVADLSAFSLYQLAEMQGLISKEEGDHNLIMQLNPYGMNMSMFHQDQPTFSRDSYSQIMAEMWTQSKDGTWIWKHTDLEQEVMLSDQFNEFDRFLNFYNNSFIKGSGQISQFILCGSYPDLDNARDMLTQRFDMEPQMLKLPSGLEQAFAPLYGLALKKKVSVRKNKMAMKKREKEHKKEKKQNDKIQKKQKKVKKQKTAVQEDMTND